MYTVIGVGVLIAGDDAYRLRLTSKRSTVTAFRSVLLAKSGSGWYLARTPVAGQRTSVRPAPTVTIWVATPPTSGTLTRKYSPPPDSTP